MTVHEIAEAVEHFAKNVVVIEGYLGHKCDAERISEGRYEETWISSNPGQQRGLRIKLPPSKAYPRPFRFHEMVNGSRTGGIVAELTEPEVMRFCGRIERSNSEAYVARLHDVQWCEIPSAQHAKGMHS